MSDFDPNAASLPDSGIFGLPDGDGAFEQARVVYLPVPWEVTTSYGGGTALAPNAIIEASKQVDLRDAELGDIYSMGLYCLPENPEIANLGLEGKALAQEEGSEHKVNTLSDKLNDWVYTQCTRLLGMGKIPVVIGGDHSTPFGAIRAYAEKYQDFGILHLDAHSDTRIAYEGFEHSHASIMYNVLTKIPGVKSLVQVGIRDCCEQEIEFCVSQGPRVSVFFDHELQELKHSGSSWKSICEKIVSKLPKNVYISFDIDGLDPKLCPGTGTPVPGGLEFSEAMTLFREVARSGKKIVGFDLNEVAPQEGDGEWNANVGARVLYKLTGYLKMSNPAG